MHALLIRVAIGWAASQSVVAVDTLAQATADNSAVTAEETEAVTVIFVERVAAYWSLGSALKDVRAYQAEQGVTGRLYVRYLDDPTAVSSGGVRTEIGVRTGDDDEPVPPFLRKRRETELVASLTLKSRRFSFSKVCARMNTWIAAHGYVRLGPVTEIYGDATGEESGSTQVEIQMPIRVAPPLPAAPGSHEASHVRNLLVGEIPHGAPAEAELDGPPAPEPEVDRKGTPEPPGNGSTEVRDEESPGEAGVSGETAPPSADPLASLTDLLATRVFDRVARRLIPDSEVLSADGHVWQGQLIFRVRAVLEGIARIYPDEGGMAEKLAEAIKQRYEQVAFGRQYDPLARAVVRVDPLNDPLADEKEAMVRDLDHLSFRVAVKAINADEAFRQVLDVIERARTVARAKHGEAD